MSPPVVSPHTSDHGAALYGGVRGPIASVGHPSPHDGQYADFRYANILRAEQEAGHWLARNKIASPSK